MVFDFPKDEFNTKLIQNYMSTNNFDELVTYTFDHLSNISDEQKYTSLEFILEVIKKGIILPQKYLEKIKSFLDSYDENLQYISLEIYSLLIQKNASQFIGEIPFCIKKLGDFENNVRSIFIDLCINYYPIAEKNQNAIINGLKKKLTDPIWKHRIKVIEFFHKLILKNSQLFIIDKDDFLVLLNENDLDVIAEGMDFLYSLILNTFSPEDFLKLIKKIPTYEWIAQDKILWLVGKIGVQNIQFINNSIPEIVKLIDSINNNLSVKSVQIINEIMDIHPNVFDKPLFKALKSGKFENLDEIETIFATSIIKLGASRFTQLYNQITPNFPEITKNFSNALQKVWLKNKHIVKYIFSSLPINVLLQADQYEFFKLETFIRDLNIYEISHLCYQNLIQIDSIGKEGSDILKEELIRFLIELCPELEHKKICEWIKKNLKNNVVKFEEICNHFNLSKDQLKLILQNLIENDQLEAIIQDDIIKIAKIDDPLENYFDLNVQKKWKIWSDNETSILNIKLSVRIKNILNEKLTDVKVIIVNDSKIFELNNQIINGSLVYPVIPSTEYKEISWIFQKKPNMVLESHIITLNLVVFYCKGLKVFSWSKKLDVLVL